MTATEIVNACDGYLPADWHKRPDASEFHRLREYGKRRRAWNLPASVEEITARKEVAR